MMSRDRCSCSDWQVAAAVFVLSCSAAGANTLDVALSNDDGWQAAGVQAMYDDLVAAGYRVTLAGPASDQSGSSAGVSVRELRVRREGKHQYSVSACRDDACSALESAKPATSAMVAIDIASRVAGGRPPALLISGINAGANTGGVTPFSGTVGAAIAAIIRSTHGPVPAIAISTDLPAFCNADEACAREQYSAVARFTTRLLVELSRRAGGGKPLLPPGMALNINYPPGTPKGVRLAVQGRSIVVGGVPRLASVICEACQDAAIGASVRAGFGAMLTDGQPDVAGSDAVSYAQGYITIVPIEADYTVSTESGLSWLAELDTGVVAAGCSGPAQGTCVTDR